MRWEGSGGDALVSLAEEVGPVGEAAGHEAGVDEGEGLVVDPDVFCVVDQELEVRWYAGNGQPMRPRKHSMLELTV